MNNIRIAVALVTSMALWQGCNTATTLDSQSAPALDVEAPAEVSSTKTDSPKPQLFAGCVDVAALVQTFSDDDEQTPTKCTYIRARDSAVANVHLQECINAAQQSTACVDQDGDGDESCTCAVESLCAYANANPPLPLPPPCPTHGRLLADVCIIQCTDGFGAVCSFDSPFLPPCGRICDNHGATRFFTCIP